MSGYVNKLFTTLSSALEFNTATLSGAIDIVVIEDDKGRRHCSPFHVRFGKLQLLKSRGIPVQIDLNGQRTSLQMLLGAAGEAYFYNPQHSSNVQSDSDVAERLPTASASNADVINIDASEAAALDVPIRANSQPIPPSSKGSSPASPYLRSEPFSFGRQNSNVSVTIPGPPPMDRTSSMQSHVIETKATDYPFGYISDSEVELTRIEREGTAEVVDEPRSPPLFSSQRKWSSTVAQNPPASHGIDQHESEDDTPTLPHDDIGSDPSDDQNSSLFGLPGSPASLSVPTPAKRADEVEKENRISSPRSTHRGALDVSPRGAGLSPKLKENADALTVSSTINDVVGEEDGKLECRSIDGYDADEDNVDDLQDLQEQVAYVLSKPQNIAVRERVEDSDGDREDAEPKSGGATDTNSGGEGATREGVIDMSLCGGLIMPDMEELQIIELFERHKVAFSEFETNPNLLNDPSLLFRVDNRLVELRVAVPFIFSVLAFNERMDIDALDRITAKETKVEEPKSPPTPSRRFRWFGWASPAVAGEPLLQEEDLAVLDDANARAARDKEKTNLDQAVITNGTEGRPADTVPRDAPANKTERDSGEATEKEDSEATHIAEHRLHSTKIETETETNIEAGTNEEDSKASAMGAQAIAPVPVAISFSELDPAALSLRPTTEQLESLPLEPGANTISFVVESSAVELNCRIFLWSSHTKIVISDVDGTITRSDVLGHLLPAVGRDWSQVGVAGLYTQIEKNGYKLLYLTARPIGQASQTRAFLHSVTQGSAKLPNGPVLMSPNRLVESFTREVIRRKPHEFKIAALRDVRSLFSPDYNPFHAGFGNRDTDVISYRAVGLIPQRIFVVNPRGELVVMKAKYESAASYSTLQDLVESVFPDISRHGGLEKIQELTESAKYNDWNYWKGALPAIDVDELLCS